jgi:hypothetical protein
MVKSIFSLAPRTIFVFYHPNPTLDLLTWPANNPLERTPILFRSEIKSQHIKYADFLLKNPLLVIPLQILD